MSAAIEDQPPTTIAAFDAFLDAQADAALWELIGGRILMMTNPSENHEQMAACGTALGQCARPGQATTRRAGAVRHFLV